MEVITKEEFKLNYNQYLDMIEKGAIFIYPTDTIYGIGCNAQNSKAVKKIRAIKKRSTVPFSVMVPTKKWIYDNCLVVSEGIKWVEKLPGPYTLIFKLQNIKAIAPEVNCGWGTLGVRIPKHWFHKVSKELNIPIVTTSANVSGENYMVSAEDLSDEIRQKADFMVYEGKKEGKPSTIINLVEEKVEIIER